MSIVPTVKADTADLMMALDPSVLLGKAELKGRREVCDLQAMECEGGRLSGCKAGRG